MAMKRIAAMLLTSVLLLSCVGCAQDGHKEPGAEKADLGLTAEVKPATDFTAKANAAVYDELDFDDKQEYEFATRGLIDAPEALELKDEDGTILWSQEAYAFLDDYEKAPDSVNPSLCREPTAKTALREARPSGNSYRTFPMRDCCTARSFTANPRWSWRCFSPNWGLKNSATASASIWPTTVTAMPHGTT